MSHLLLVVILKGNRNNLSFILDNNRGVKAGNVSSNSHYICTRAVPLLTK